MTNGAAVGDLKQSATASERSLGLAPGVIKSRYRLSAIASVRRDVVVYAAEDVRSGQQIALEVLRDEFAADTDFVAALCDQANKLAKSVHVNRAVARVYECDKTEDGIVFVAREPVDGRVLREILDEHGALDASTALRIASQVGEALEMLHHNGIIHGELGAESVLMVRDADGTENPRLAGVELTAANRTSAGLRLRDAASAVHLAPEQIELGQTTEAADVYALGRLLKELLTADAVREVGGIRPTPVPVPPTINRIITTALDARPNLRYPDISVMVNDIWGAHTELSEPKARPRAVTPPPTISERALRLSRAMLGVAPVVAGAAIVLAVIAWAAMSVRIVAHFRPVPAPVLMTVPAEVLPAADVTKPIASPPPSVEASKPSLPAPLPAIVEMPSPSRPAFAETPTAPEPGRPGRPPTSPSSPPPVVRPDRSAAGDSRPTVERSTTTERGSTIAERRGSTTSGQRPPAVEQRAPAPSEQHRAAPAAPAAPAEPRSDSRADEAGDGSAIIDWLLKDRR